jgi:hypothetical protein
MPNNFQPHVPDFQRGERLSAARLNELADAVARMLWHKQQSANAAFGVKPPLEIIGKLDDDLPAATNFGTTPGEAVMSVWFKDQNGDLIDSGRNENIKQRFESAEAKAAGDEVRAAWIEGEWVALPSGGSGKSCNTVRFQILVADPLTRTALCVITARPYGCGVNDIPGTLVSGQAIEVCDPGGCFFNETNPPLVGREGWANYMMPVQGSTWCQQNPYYGMLPEWEVFSLCCATDACLL